MSNIPVALPHPDENRPTSRRRHAMTAARRRERFEGAICGFGSTSGCRIVVGHWRSSPFGAFSDVMAESSSGHRLLVAPSQRVADYVSATYTFDEVTVTPVTVEESTGRWDVHAGPVQAAVTFGRRLPLGRLLRLVPRSVATTPRWATLVNPIARLALRGVQTVGSAGGGRREWYCVTDLRAVIAVAGEFAGRDLGSLAPVDPPTSFGFSSTPRHPSLASVVTFVETSGATSR